MPDKDEAIVEAMARARCEALRIHPDYFYREYTFEGEVEWGKGWWSQKEEAKAQLAAHRAMIWCFLQDIWNLKNPFKG